MIEGYKVTELGSIPESWQVSELGKYANVVMGQSPNSSSYNSIGEGIYLIQGNADIKGRISCPRVWTTETTKKCQVGDILMTVRAPVGAVAKSKHNACIGRGVCAINSTQLDNEFLYQYLISKECDWKSLEQGSTFTAVNGADIKSLKLHVPPLPEQQKIASILSTVDEKIEIIDAQISQTQELKKGLMQQLLSRGIGHTKFKSSELGDIPESWEVVSANNCGIEFVDGDRGTNYPKQHDLLPEGDCLFLSAKNVTKSGFRFTECQFISFEKDSQLRKGKLTRNDIVITTRGSVGNIALYDNEIQFENIRLNSGMVIFRDVQSQFDARFLYYLLRSFIFQTQIEKISFGSAQPQLTIAELKKTRLLIIPIIEQKKIASILTVLENKLSSLQSRKETYQQLKKGLMQQLLTGKIRVNTSQNEPALA